MYLVNNEDRQIKYESWNISILTFELKLSILILFGHFILFSQSLSIIFMLDQLLSIKKFSYFLNVKLKGKHIYIY